MDKKTVRVSVPHGLDFSEGAMSLASMDKRLKQVRKRAKRLGLTRVMVAIRQDHDWGPYIVIAGERKI